MRFLPIPTEFALFLVLLSVFCVSGISGRELEIKDDLREANGSAFARYYVDPAGTNGIAEVSAKNFKGFSDSQNGSLIFGLTRRPVWVEMRIKNSSQKSRFVLSIEFPPLDRIEFFTPHQNSFQKSEAGDSLPFPSREILDRNYHFPVSIPAGETKTFYFRITSESILNIPLYVRSEEYLQSLLKSERFYYGIFFGLILLSVFYNFFLFLSIREKLYIFYALYIGFFGLFYAIYFGFAYELFWPGSPYLAGRMNLFSANAMVFFGVLFSMEFLDVKKNYPLLFLRLGYILAGLFLTACCFSFFLDYRLMVIVTSLSGLFFTAVVFFATAGYGLVKRIPLSGVFTVAFFGQIILGAVWVTSNAGILTKEFLRLHIIELAASFQVMALSFGLAYRYNGLKKEKEALEIESSEARQSLFAIRRELKVAQQIHSSLLPSSAPEIPGLEISFVYAPCGSLGGDFLDFSVRTDHEVELIIADVTGHGLAAALFASAVRMAYKAEAQKKSNNPAQILQNMNRVLFQQLGGNFLSAAILRVDALEQHAFFSDAGHPPLLLQRRGSGGEILSFKPPGTLLGIFPEIVTENAGISLKPGDRIILYSDGLTECLNGKETFEDFRFMEAIRKGTDLNAEEFSRSIMQDVIEFSFEGGGATDDITCIVVDVLGDAIARTEHQKSARMPASQGRI